jgi:hypothetical protein
VCGFSPYSKKGKETKSELKFLLEINNEVYEGIALSLNKMQNLPEFPSGSTESQSKRPGPLRLAKGLGLRSELLSGQEDESVTPACPAWAT